MTIPISEWASNLGKTTAIKREQLAAYYLNNQIEPNYSYSYTDNTSTIKGGNITSGTVGTTTINNSGSPYYYTPTSNIPTQYNWDWKDVGLNSSITLHFALSGTYTVIQDGAYLALTTKDLSTVLGIVKEYKPSKFEIRTKDGIVSPKDAIEKYWYATVLGNVLTDKQYENQKKMIYDVPKWYKV